MTEECVTKALLSWLRKTGWKIICFDFPQSGTGRILHPNHADTEKNKGSIIPDIVAVKNHTSLFFENKDRFYLPDYEKVNKLITDNQYIDAISGLLCDYERENIYYGIGLPAKKHTEKSKQFANLVDFIVGVESDKSVVILHNPKGIVF